MDRNHSNIFINGNYFFDGIKNKKTFSGKLSCIYEQKRVKRMKSTWWVVFGFDTDEFGPTVHLFLDIRKGQANFLKIFRDQKIHLYKGDILSIGIKDGTVTNIKINGGDNIKVALSSKDSAEDLSEVLTDVAPWHQDSVIYNEKERDYFLLCRKDIQERVELLPEDDIKKIASIIIPEICMDMDFEEVWKILAKNSAYKDIII